MQHKTAMALTTILGLAAGSGMEYKFKAPKSSRPKREYTVEQQAELDRLFQDRTSSGRKQYKAYKKSLA